MSTLPDSRAQNMAWWLISIAWLAGWHLFITWHVWADPVRMVPGPIGDNTVMLWNLGWVQHALNSGSPGFWFPNAYYPDGFLFLYGTHTWLDGLLSWVISPVLPGGLDGLVLWANLNMMVATVASGLLIILALRGWGIKHWPVLLLASSGAVFSWFRIFAMMGHYHFFGTHWMLLALCLLSWGKQKVHAGDFKSAHSFFLFAGLALGITFLNDQTMTVFAALLGGMVFVGMLFLSASIADRIRTVMSAAVRFYGLALIPASIHLVPLAVAAVTDRLHFRVDVQGPRLVDATSVILPPDFHILRPWLFSLRQQYGLSWSEGTYIGVVPALLLIMATAGSVTFAVTRAGERPKALRVCFYATVAAWLFLICALGDRLVVGREQFVSLPGRLLKELPILNNIRLPQRWVWPAHLCIALAGAGVLSHLLANSQRKWLNWLPVALAVLPPLEGKSYPPPQPLDLRDYPILQPLPVVNAVKQHYSGGSVLMMPLSEAYSRGNILQLLWGFDIPLTFSYTAKMPYLLHETPVNDDLWSEDDLRWLQEKQVKIVVFPLHNDSPERLQDWVRKARENVPELIVLNQNGTEI